MVCGAVPDSSVPGLVWPMARDQSVLLKVLEALRNADADRIKQAADTIYRLRRVPSADLIGELVSRVGPTRQAAWSTNCSTSAYRTAAGPAQVNPGVTSCLVLR
jgi:hypothetical protein